MPRLLGTGRGVVASDEELDEAAKKFERTLGGPEGDEE